MRRRSRRLAVAGAGAVALLMTACGNGARRDAGPAPCSGFHRDAFYAVMAAADGAVEAVSPTSGKPLCRVAGGKRDRMDTAGLSSAGSQALLVTYARGPECTSNVAGCGPRPHTCGAEVVRVDLAKRRTTVVWSVGRDTMLRDAALSPDGSMLVARESPCVPSYFNDHLVVRRVDDGATWTIGAKVPRCHWVGRPQWLAGSRRVVITYAAPSGTTPYTGADGTCSSFGDENLVRLDVTRGSPAITGDVVAPRRSCTWRDVAVAGADTYAVEACGKTSERLDGPVTLVKLDRSLQRQREWTIGRCSDGDSVAAGDNRGVVVSAYLFCNPPPGGGPAGDPITVLDRLDAATLRRVAAAPGGFTAWDSIAW